MAEAVDPLSCSTDESGVHRRGSLKHESNHDTEKRDSVKSVTFGQHHERKFSENLHAESVGEDVLAKQAAKELEQKMEKQRIRDQMRKECGYINDDPPQATPQDEQPASDSSARTRKGTGSADLSAFASLNDDDDEPQDEGRTRSRTRGDINEEDIDAFANNDEPDDSGEGRSRARTRGGISEEDIDAFANDDEPDDVGEGRSRARSRGGICAEDIDAVASDEDKEEEDMSGGRSRARSRVGISEEDLDGHDVSASEKGLRFAAEVDICGGRSRTATDSSDVSSASKASSRKTVSFGKTYSRKFSETLHDESAGVDVMVRLAEKEQAKQREKQRIRDEMRRECGYAVDEAPQAEEATGGGGGRSRARSSGIGEDEIDDALIDDDDDEPEDAAEGRTRSRSRGGFNEDDLDGSAMDDEPEDESEGRTRSRSHGGINEDDLDALAGDDDEPEEMCEGRGRARSRMGISEDDLPDDQNEKESVDSADAGLVPEEICDESSRTSSELRKESDFLCIGLNDDEICPMTRTNSLERSEEYREAPQIGDRLQALAGKQLLSKSGNELFKADDYSVVTSRHTSNDGNPMMTLAWERTGKTTFMGVSIWLQWVKVVDKAPKIGDRVQALAEKEFAGKSGVQFFVGGDYGVVKSLYTDEGHPKMNISWDRTQKTGFMAMSIWPLWIKTLPSQAGVPS